MKKAPRKNPTALQKKELQQEAGSKCAWCGDENPEGWEFHHIDGRPENTVNENLILLCGKCHNIAEAQNGKITIDDLYQRKRELAERRKHAQGIPQRIVRSGGSNTQNNSPNINNINGNVYFSPKQEMHIHTKTKVKEKYIPGTIEANPQMNAYLAHLLSIYNKFYKYDCECFNRRPDYSRIRREAIEAFGYKMAQTPETMAEELFEFIRRRIAGTMIGKKKLKAGEPLVCSFDEFKRRH